MLAEVRALNVVASCMKPDEKREWIDPESIERVQEVEVFGIDEPCCRLLIGNEWLTCIGTAEEFVKASNLAFVEANIVPPEGAENAW